jgi:hypothetical protein
MQLSASWVYIPIVVASTCLGIVGDLSNWGFGKTIAAIVVLQCVLLFLGRKRRHAPAASAFLGGGS